MAKSFLELSLENKEEVEAAKEMIRVLGITNTEAINIIWHLKVALEPRTINIEEVTKSLRRVIKCLKENQ